MTDGRVHTPEDELELLDEDISQTERRLDDLGRERARVVSEPEIGQAMWRLEERLKTMRTERERLVAAIKDEDRVA